MSKLISNLISKPLIKQMIRYAIVGAIGTVVNLSILYILTEFFHIHYIFSEIVAFVLAALNNYILDKIWTFKENIQTELIKKWFQFILINLIALAVNLTILFILVEFFYIWYIFAEVLAICGAFLINFFGNRTWTFNNNTKNSNPK